jgi:hypothetical protein
MANSFIDTSALVKYYHSEDGTQEVMQILEEPVSRHYISRLSLVETVSAFAVKFRDRLTLQLIELTIFAPTLLGSSEGAATNLSWATSTPADCQGSSLCACPREKPGNANISA